MNIYANRLTDIVEIFAEKLDKICPLSGTEKQIEWANKIRSRLTRNVMLCYAYRAEHNHLFIKINENFIKKSEQFILSKTDAKFWIENRDKDYTQFQRLIEDTLYFEEPKEEKIVDEAKTEATIYPSDQKTKVVAEIFFDEEVNRIRVKSEKDFTVINVVKDLGYTWGGKTWWYEIVPYKGDLSDRMAEVGNKLLLAGVPVIIWNETIRQKAVNGEYGKECFRWVTRNKKNCIDIIWEFRSDKLYKEARKLPHAEWNNGGMIVPARYYAEIRDFAKINDFKISSGAEELLSKAEDEEKSQSKTTIKEAIISKKEQDTQLSDILNSPRDILDDLKDD